MPPKPPPYPSHEVAAILGSYKAHQLFEREYHQRQSLLQEQQLEERQLKKRQLEEQHSIHHPEYSINPSGNDDTGEPTPQAAVSHESQPAPQIQPLGFMLFFGHINALVTRNDLRAGIQRALNQFNIDAEIFKIQRSGIYGCHIFFTGAPESKNQILALSRRIYLSPGRFICIDENEAPDANAARALIVNINATYRNHHLSGGLKPDIGLHEPMVIQETNIKGGLFSAPRELRLSEAAYAGPTPSST